MPLVSKCWQIGGVISAQLKFPNPLKPRNLTFTSSLNFLATEFHSVYICTSFLFNYPFQKLTRHLETLSGWSARINGYIKIPWRRPLTQIYSGLKDEPRLAWGEGGLTIGCPGIDSSHSPIFHTMTLWRNHHWCLVGQIHDCLQLILPNCAWYPSNALRIKVAPLLFNLFPVGPNRASKGLFCCYTSCWFNKQVRFISSLGAASSATTSNCHPVNNNIYPKTLDSF